MEKKCILCDAPAKSCASCKSVAYCSPECQHTDWPVHKTLCKKIGSFAVGNPRPVDGKLALLFPENEKAPRLVWVICEEKSEESLDDDEDDYVFHMPHVRALLGGTPDSRVLADNQYRSIDIDKHTVSINCLDDFSRSRVNQCVLETTRRAAPHRWAGPIVVLNQIGEYDDPLAQFQDVTLADLRIAVDYFKAYGCARRPSSHEELAAMARASKPRKGVKVLCEAHRSLRGGRKCVQVNVPRDHPVYEEQATSISRTMGLPLLMRQYPPDKAWADVAGSCSSSSSSPWLNSAATSLALSVDPDGSSFGLADTRWTEKVGSVLVVREDGKDFTAEQAWALSEYCQSVLGPKIDDCLEGGDVRRAGRELVGGWVTRAAFEGYLEEFKEKMGTAGGDWASVVSPYSVT